MVSDPSTNRAIFPRLTLLFVGLALAVIMWGLGYKLSLYDPPQATTHLMPTAKLLSRDQQTSAEDALAILSRSAADARLIHAVVPAALLAFLLASSLTVVTCGWQRNRELNRPWLVRSRVCMDAFFFRPPPLLY
jgi:hypothetical protein